MIGRICKYTITNSPLIIIINKSFLRNSAKASLSIALSYEYAHDFIEDHLRMFWSLPNRGGTPSIGSFLLSQKLYLGSGPSGGPGKTDQCPHGWVETDAWV